MVKSAPETAVDSPPNEDEIFEVEAILKMKRLRNGKKFYRIRWKGFTPEHDTWEPEENIDCKKLLEEFLSSKKKTPVPKRRLSSPAPSAKKRRLPTPVPAAKIAKKERLPRITKKERTENLVSSKLASSEFYLIVTNF